MKKSGLVILVIVLLGFLYSCNQPKKESESEKDYEVKIKVNDLEPDDSFYKAEKAYIDQDFTTSAAEIMNGVRYMRELLSYAAPEQKKELERSIGELSDFAEQVRGDRINGFKDFQFFFARAGKALSTHHVNISETIVGQGNDYKEAARHLIRAIHYMRYYYAKSGEEITKDEQKQLHMYEKAARKIIKEQRVDNINKLFDDAFKNINGQILMMSVE